MTSERVLCMPFACQNNLFGFKKLFLSDKEIRKVKTRKTSKNALKRGFNSVWVLLLNPGWNPNTGGILWEICWRVVLSTEQYWNNFEVDSTQYRDHKLILNRILVTKMDKKVTNISHFLPFLFRVIVWQNTPKVVSLNYRKSERFQFKASYHLSHFKLYSLGITWCMRLMCGGSSFLY